MSDLSQSWRCQQAKGTEENLEITHILYPILSIIRYNIIILIKIKIILCYYFITEESENI